MSNTDQLPDTVELPRANAIIYQRAYKLLDALMSNTATATSFKRLAKAADPKGELIKVPDIELADEVAKPINDRIATLEAENKKLRDEIVADKQKLKDDADLRDINTRIDEVVRKRRLTEDGRKGLIETMQKRQIADPDAAALVYLESLPKPDAQKPSAILPQRMGQFTNPREPFFGADEDKVKKFMAEPEAAADEEIARILNEAQEAA
jgi:hypothetical protein